MGIRKDGRFGEKMRGEENVGRRKRCSRKMRGSKREVMLALGTMVMRKPNQTLGRPTTEPAGELITYQTMENRSNFTLFYNILLDNVLSRHTHPPS